MSTNQIQHPDLPVCLTEVATNQRWAAQICTPEISGFSAQQQHDAASEEKTMTRVPGATESSSNVCGGASKYEEAYLRAYGRVSEARAGIGRYLTFYNSRRPHLSLDSRTPDQAHFNQPMPEAVAA